uniref:Hypotheticial protein n=1 Tax=Schistosoma japonicum TaxID=6182 RepID=C7TZB8_SCHJA|nr:hypotheticial protein [Schistosoma japonicum]
MWKKQEFYFMYNYFMQRHHSLGTDGQKLHNIASYRRNVYQCLTHWVLSFGWHVSRVLTNPLGGE